MSDPDQNKTEPQTEADVPTPSVKQPKQGAGHPTWGVLIAACMLTAMLSIGASTWLNKSAAPAHGLEVAILNPQKLTDAKLAELLNKGATPEDISKEGKALATKIVETVDQLSAEGVLVIHAGAVMNENDPRDITNDLAKRLGLNMSAKVDTDKVMQNIEKQQGGKPSDTGGQEESR